MEQINRLGWTAGISFAAYGVKFGVRSNDPLVLKRARALLPPGSARASSPSVDFMFSILAGGWASKRGVKRFNIAYANAERVARDLDIELVLRQLQSEMQRTVAEEARTHHFLHAGVVEWNGTAIMIPGPTLSGKSSLVLEFLRAGAKYYSDEYAVLDLQGRVHPFPRAIATRDSEGRPAGQIDPTELGSATGRKPLPISLILMTRYRSGARWRPLRLSPGKAVLELLANSLSARRNPERAMMSLQKIAASAEVFKSRRGETREVVDWVQLEK
jgi:hypothetical protein